MPSAFVLTVLFVSWVGDGWGPWPLGYALDNWGSGLSLVDSQTRVGSKISK